MPWYIQTSSTVFNKAPICLGLSSIPQTGTNDYQLVAKLTEPILYVIHTYIHMYLSYLRIQADRHFSRVCYLLTFKVISI